MKTRVWPCRDLDLEKACEFLFRRVREEIVKQKGFVSDLGNYNVQQWVEFFHVKASTAQALVEEIGPFYRQRDGTCFFATVDFRGQC